MDIVEYTTFLVKELVNDAEMVSVKEIGSDDEVINLEVLVKDTDMGSLIGKDGKTASALRVIIQAYSYLHDKKKVKINIDSF